MMVAEWLERLGLAQYLPAFEANAITPELLPRLTAEDLKDIGVTLVGHRRILLDAVAALQPASRTTAEVPTEDPPGERRQVTVLFADLVGFTRLSSEVDPEDVHAILNDFFALADRAVIDHGGAVDKHIGDCVMAVFGAPVAHQNDAERAVLSAIAIRDGMHRLAEKYGRDIDTHVGIASGEVIAAIGGEAHREYTVTGESVNLASRLTDRAKSGEILVSAEVHDTLAQRFAAEPAGNFDLKGFASPLAAWRLLKSEVAPAAESNRPFFGRQAEIRQFRAALDQCRADRHGQAVYLRGDPGIGKTRLVEELARIAEASGFARVAGTVLDFGGDKGLAAIAGIAAGFLDLIAPGDLPRQEKLDSAGLVMSERLMLAGLLDLNLSEDERGLVEAMDNQTRTRHGRDAIASLLTRACQIRPVLAVIEDLHWADAQALDLVASLAESVAGLPALLLATSRVENEPMTRHLRAAGPSLTIDLAPLPRGDALALAASYFGPDADWVESCVDRAAGNPLFLDQLLQHVKGKAGGSVPTTIQSLVQARMDQLPPRERRALQTAAVLGQSFRIDALRHLLGDARFDCDLLVERHLLRKIGAEFLFAHALIRDAAYATLLKERRRQLHKMAAAWLAETDPPLAAEHLAMAEDDAAPRACLAAALTLIGRFRYEHALSLIARGLSVAKDADDRVALLLGRGEALHLSGGARAAIDAFAEARRAAVAPRDICRALLGLASARRIVDEIDQSFADVAEAITIAERESLTEEAARAYGLRGNLRFPRGEIDDCWSDHNHSLALARQAGSAELETAALGGIGDAEYMRGRTSSAFARFSECVATAAEHDLTRIEAAYLPMQGITHMWIGNAEESRAMCLHAVEAARRIGHERAEAVAHHGVLLSCRQLLRTDEERLHVDAAIVLSERLHALRFLAEGLLFRGLIAIDAGHPDAARSDVAEALRISRGTGMAYIGPVVLAGCAHVAQSDAERQDYEREAEALLAAGSPCHNHFIFRQEMIGLAVTRRDGATAHHHASALEAYCAAEPSEVSRFIVARARALAEHCDSRAALGELQDLIAAAERLGRLHDRNALLAALEM